MAVAAGRPAYRLIVGHGGSSRQVCALRKILVEATTNALTHAQTCW